MRQNALLRSAKDLELPDQLDLPGTARKQDPKTTAAKAVSTKPVNVAVVAPPAAEERVDHFAVRQGVRCAGVHLIVDLREAQGLDDIDMIEATLRHCVETAGATLLHIHLHHFQPNGVSGVAVLAESHISIHTWPDIGYAALDIFMCGKAEPERCIPVLAEAFKAKRVEVNELLRGRMPEHAG
jgi:S-adenosylmethionine decarboxylase